MQTATREIVASRFRVNSVLSGITSLFMLAAWFLPWFMMTFGGNASSSLAESPYLIATQETTSALAWALLLVIAGIVALSIRAFMGLRRPVIEGALWTLSTLVLALIAYRLLATMGVVAFYGGQHAANVTLLPQVGLFLIVLGFALSIATTVRMWLPARA